MMIQAPEALNQHFQSQQIEVISEFKSLQISQ